MQEPTKSKTTLSPQALRELRLQRQMSLKQFWGALGYSPSRGCAYETGKTKLPRHARRLVYLEYVAGVPTDIDSVRFQQFESVCRALDVIKGAAHG